MNPSPDDRDAEFRAFVKCHEVAIEQVARRKAWATGVHESEVRGESLSRAYHAWTDVLADKSDRARLAWLAGTMWNVGREIARRRRDVPVERSPEPHGPATDPQRTAFLRAVLAAIPAVLAELPETEQKILALSFSGFRIQEIAVTVGLSRQRVGELLARARERLRDGLRALGLDLDDGNEQ